uniref:Integrase catalytic domain-containing protein n=1 Tax=Scylla olivacea TaxID=85551 RepID=A0A0P4VXI1_SCYOL
MVKCTWLTPTGAQVSKIMAVLRQHFARWGAPESISTDGGTNLTSEEVSKFMESWGVAMRTSSAHFPQSNGRAEVAVKSAKRLLRDNSTPGGSLNIDKFPKAMLQYLNTPLREGDKSPAQLATGRQLRDDAPSTLQDG